MPTSSCLGALVWSHTGLSGWEEHEPLRVTLTDGYAFTGRSTIIAHQHFLMCADPQNVLEWVAGPIENLDPAGVEVLHSRSKALAEGRHRLMDDCIPDASR